MEIACGRNTRTSYTGQRHREMTLCGKITKLACYLPAG